MSEYLKIPEVARRLDVSEKTARRYIRSGELPSTFIGGAYRVSEEDLASYQKGAIVKPEELAAPPKAEPFSLDWARIASDSEFYTRIITAEDPDLLGKLSGELASFLGRPMRRILAERNDKPFTDSGPEPSRDEYERMKERFDALYAEVNRRRPPIAWLRMSDEGNVCRWNIRRDEWDEHRADVEAFFGDEKYDDVDAREDDQVHEVPLYAHA